MTEVRRGPRARKPNEGGVIDAVRPSIAEAIGLRAGDRIVAIDGARAARRRRRPVTTPRKTSISLEVIRDGAALTFEVEKHPDEDLGIGFQDAAFDGVRICNNTCFFCFLKGNPKGMRKTLYVKDDDYRLSFFHGNFVTLTNLTEDDWARLEEQRLSPLNVSVHATEPELRRYLLGNKHAPDICEQLRRLGDLGIEANTQVVLCPGVNDGDALDRTIERSRRAVARPSRTISVVPVGATMAAEERIARGAHAEEIDGCTPEYARAVIAQVAPVPAAIPQRARTHARVPRRRVLPRSAGLSPPPAPALRRLPAVRERHRHDAHRCIEDWRRHERRRLNGSASRPVVHAALSAHHARLRHAHRTDAQRTSRRELGGRDRRARSTCAPIANTFFGPRVNVSGLLVGGDIERAAAGHRPRRSRRSCRATHSTTPAARFLDDVTPAAAAGGARRAACLRIDAERGLADSRASR